MPKLSRVLSAVALFMAVGTTSASALPPIEVSAQNPVPSCVTPSRLMTYLRTRNPSLDDRLASIAAEYQRQGDALGIRWDYAFFQMVVETAGLSYRRPDGTPGRVRPDQNNFAAVGLREEGAPGKRFATLASGVKAHLQQVARHSHPHAGFADLARKWAPDEPRYGAAIESVARRFFDTACQQPARQPEVAAVSLREQPRQVVAALASVPVQTRDVVLTAPTTNEDQDRKPGKNLVRESADRERDNGTSRRAGLGAPPALELPPAEIADVSVEPPKHVETPKMALRMAALTPMKKHEPAKPAVDPADEAVRTLVSGRTVFLDTPVGTQIPIAFREDGSMQGKAGDLASYLGARIDEGKWWVHRGRLCQQFKVWFEKETQCLTLRQSGQIVHWSSDKGKSGTARLGPRS